jgi:deazaflavin-dependent oxidoreductase (nitroreductase family)
MTTNVFIYRLTRGRLGSKMAGQSVLLLHTVGRKSGKSFTTPVNYYGDGENYVLVASNWGKDNHPAWFYNLKQHPDTTVQVKDRIIRVVARQAAGQEYERLWKFVTSKNGYYVRYQAGTRRSIPIVILVPQTQ